MLVSPLFFFFSIEFLLIFVPLNSYDLDTQQASDKAQSVTDTVKDKASDLASSVQPDSGKSCTFFPHNLLRISFEN